jgi:hypothetical protein
MYEYRGRWHSLECSFLPNASFGFYVTVKLSLHKPLGLREIEAPTFSEIRLIDGGKVVSLKRRPLFTPKKISGTHF